MIRSTLKEVKVLADESAGLFGGGGFLTLPGVSIAVVAGNFSTILPVDICDKSGRSRDVERAF